MGCYGPEWNTTYLYKTSNCFFVLDGRLSFLCLLCFPPRCKLHLIHETFPKPKPEDRRTSRVCLPPAPLQDMGLLFMALNLHPPVYITYSVFKKISALSNVYSCPGSLFSLLFPLSLRIAPSASFYVRGESSGICWTRKSSQTDGLFLALNENWQLEYAIHHLIYPPNWKAGEELNTREESAVCLLTWVNSLTSNAFFVACGVQDR